MKISQMEKFRESSLGALGRQLHSPCMTYGCENPTQHKTGYCEACRTASCSFCSTVFVSTTAPAPNLCSKCRCYKNRKKGGG